MSRALTESAMVSAIGANIGIKHAATYQQLLAIAETEGLIAVLPFNLRQAFVCLNEVNVIAELSLGVSPNKALVPDIVASSLQYKLAFVACSVGTGPLRERVYAIQEVTTSNWKEVFQKWTSKMSVPTIALGRVKQKLYIYAPLRAWMPC